MRLVIQYPSEDNEKIVADLIAPETCKNIGIVCDVIEDDLDNNNGASIRHIVTNTRIFLLTRSLDRLGDSLGFYTKNIGEAEFDSYMANALVSLLMEKYDENLADPKMSIVSYTLFHLLNKLNLLHDFGMSSWRPECNS